MKTHSDELAVFVQVVESGSFSRAAERLGLANSAVSRTVKRLEDKLSANLLNRTTRQLRLTEEGCRFFERARQILHELLPDRALNEAKPFYAVYYGDNAVSPKIRAFVDFLAERLGERWAGAT